WHCQGFGFGEIAKAYLLAKKFGTKPGDYFGMKKGGMGWGNIIKDANNKNCDPTDPNKPCIKHSDLSMGQVMKGNSGKPTKTANTQSGSKGKGKGKGGSGGKGKGGGG